MSWKENINTIKEIYPGQYQMTWDFATNSFLQHILDESYKYVWVTSHRIYETLEKKESAQWKEYSLPLTDNKTSYRVLERHITFDFVMAASDFKELLPKLTPPDILLVQLNTLPKYYLDLGRITGKTRYELLSKECDYLFEVELSAATD